MFKGLKGILRMKECCVKVVYNFNFTRGYADAVHRDCVCNYFYFYSIKSNELVSNGKIAGNVQLDITFEILLNV